MASLLHRNRHSFHCPCAFVATPDPSYQPMTTDSRAYCSLRCCCILYQHFIYEFHRKWHKNGTSVSNLLFAKVMTFKFRSDHFILHTCRCSMRDCLAFPSSGTIDRHDNFHATIYSATLSKCLLARYCSMPENFDNLNERGRRRKAHIWLHSMPTKLFPCDWVEKYWLLIMLMIPLVTCGGNCFNRSSAVRPSLSVTRKSAPNSSRIFTTESFPHNAASCKAVPQIVTRFTYCNGNIFGMNSTRP